MNLNRKLSLAALAIGLLAVAGEVAFGQLLVHVQGPAPNLTIFSGTPTGGPNTVVNSNSRLRYKKRLTPTKITVSTNCPGQSFNLKVVATGVTVGIAAPEVSLVSGTPGIDFITGIPAGFLGQADATLKYTATATYQQGNSIDFGNDIHVVTYTLVAQ